MYPVSEAFLQAVQQNTRKYYWTGRITTKTDMVYEFVLLHQFRKKSQKTPQRELKKAKAERDDYLARKEADKK